MNVVAHATLFHAQCAITRRTGGPMVDLGRDFDMDHQGRFYLHADAVHDLAQECSKSDLVEWTLVDGAEVTQAQEELATALERVAELEAKLEKELGFRESLDVIVSAGFRARNKPGRPPKNKAAVTAAGG